MRTAIIGSVIIAVLAGGWMVWQRGHAEEPALAQKKDSPKKDSPKPDKKKVKELMAMKLDQSQKLLAALVMNNLEKAIVHAEELQRIRKEAAWLIVKTEQYEIWSKEFSDAAERIIKGAKDKNLDKAKLAYLELTMTCFHCHAYVRDLGDIGLDGFAPTH
jgi:hypothetical protein